MDDLTEFKVKPTRFQSLLSGM